MKFLNYKWCCGGREKKNLTITVKLKMEANETSQTQEEFNETYMISLNLCFIISKFCYNQQPDLHNLVIITFLTIQTSI